MRMIEEQTEDAEVSMSPLIDCVFLLLIFFLVATMLKQVDKDIDISLPDSGSAVKLPAEDDTLVIGIDATGGLYYEGAPTGRNDLHQYLREVAIATPERRIRLDADAAAPFHRVVEVLDACQFRGLNNVGIRTYDDQYNTR